MTIRYACAECGATMKIKDKLAGKEGHCPKCKKAFVIPGGDKEDEHLSLDGDDDLFPGSAEPRFEPTPPPRPAKMSARTAEAFAEAIPSTSNTASDLLKQAAATSRNKSTKPQKLFGLREGDEEERSRVDVGETLKYVTLNALGPLLGIAALVMVVYWLSSTVLGDKAKLPKLGQVGGTVTIDGAPQGQVRVIFQPIAETDSDSANTGSASYGTTDEQGRYLLGYTPTVRGAVVGKHHVEVTGTLLETKNGETVLTPFRRQGTYEVKPGRNTIDLPLQSTPTPPTP